MSFKDNISGIVESFVDSNQVVSGSFNSWFASTNSDFPFLSQVALIVRCSFPTNWFDATPWGVIGMATNGWRQLTNGLAKLVWTRSTKAFVYTTMGIRLYHNDTGVFPWGFEDDDCSVTTRQLVGVFDSGDI